jgi:hypothetical protein
MTGGQVTDLTPLQLAGNNSIAFNLNFEQIPERFFAGNRLYFEFGLSRDSAVAGRTIKYDRRFLDFEGLHISRTNHSALSAVQISWIIAISILYAHRTPQHHRTRRTCRTRTANPVRLRKQWFLLPGAGGLLDPEQDHRLPSSQGARLLIGTTASLILFFPTIHFIHHFFLFLFSVVCLFFNQLPLYSLPCNYNVS